MADQNGLMCSALLSREEVHARQPVWEKIPERPHNHFVEGFSSQTGCSEFISQRSRKLDMSDRQNPLVRNVDGPYVLLRCICFHPGFVSGSSQPLQLSLHLLNMRL